MRFLAFRLHLGRNKLQDGRRWAQHSGKMALDGLMLAQDGRKLSSRWPKMAPFSPKDVFKLALFCLLDLIFVQISRKMTEDCWKVLPRWATMAARWFKVDP